MGTKGKYLNLVGIGEPYASRGARTVREEIVRVKLAIDFHAKNRFTGKL